MFETSKHVPKTEKRCCVFENNRFICAKEEKQQLWFITSPSESIV